MTEQNEGTGAPASSVNAGAGGASSAPPQGQAAAGTAPAQDWRSSLAPDLRSDQTLAKYQGVDALAKAHIELQRTIGGRVKVPGENDAPEVVAQFRKALGVPEAPDGYQRASPPTGGTRPARLSSARSPTRTASRRRRRRRS
jgi:hypothetical protein